MAAAIHNNNMKHRQSNAGRRTARNNRKAKKNRRMIASLTKCIILFSNHNVTNADESGNAVELTKYYKTITIQIGDTLWSIADEYKSGDYRTVQDYVDELRSMNDLHSDNILAGQKLVVAYFVAE